MTQSGQGEEPSARVPREGIVLPSDGGQPLLPGTAGRPAGPGGLPPAQPAGAEPYAAAPAGGQAWGGPWGPDAGQTAPPQPSGQDWPAAPAESWNGYGTAAQTPAPTGAGPLPPEGAPAPGAQGGSYGYPAASSPQTSGSYGYPAPQSGAPLPPADQAGPAGQAYGAAGAPSAAEAATQYLPPVGASPAGDEGATQYIPPVAAAPADEGATQYLPPVAPGAMATAAAGNPDAEPTQYMPPVTAQGGPAYGAGQGGRQTPAEFDNLFRDGAGSQPATQQMPRLQQPAPAGPAGPSAPVGNRGGGGRGGRRSGSRVPMIAAAGVGIVVVGVGAGALLSGGGEDDSAKKNTSVASAAPSASSAASPSPTVDPAREQAVALDQLLADSGSSRASVIKAVDDVKKCDNLEQAASDLRAAAQQRNELVTRLGTLAVDKLPGHAELTDALTKAWKASASADQHYAAWADQTRGKKGCHKGKARTTSQAQAGNQQSGVASAQKNKAAQLWNTIAQQYGLTERQPTEL
ncbi:hypothetical protein [Streptomyces thermoviolaceus]|uniref:hypothetical protein n=1 Tax=Streptomyces thermoviolaceus TaxID=1952 RepID=UPI0016755E84|nr:hypothetical protein [Streptomyces thermoviolaceus]WTD48757.1 hypothetical protein OG899_15300 [Streptomyces thermoviolaceus]GGV69340.1 hypothetical protein GCM10010499_17760 [Streptomyces thermoviolaceus subsp. apingens]